MGIQSGDNPRVIEQKLNTFVPPKLRAARKGGRVSHGHAEEPQSAGVPEWVVTFGDMMSLLLTFFMLLFSMSEIKQEQSLAMVESLRRQFGHDTAMVSPLPGKMPPLNSEHADDGLDGPCAPAGHHERRRQGPRPGGRLSQGLGRSDLRATAPWAGSSTLPRAPPSSAANRKTVSARPPRSSAANRRRSRSAATPPPVRCRPIRPTKTTGTWPMPAARR